MNTLGGELLSHLATVLLLTLLIAPLVLWRYRRAVLGGMMARPGPTLPMAAPAAPVQPASVAAADRSPASWAQRVQRRVFIGVGGAAFVAALPLSALVLQLGELPLTPAHLYLKAGVLACIAVPVTAVLCALPWQRTLRLAVGTLLALAAFAVVLSMLQRPFYGKAPSLDQALNFVVWLQYAASTLWLPLLLGLATGARRVRGVAPIVLAGLLVFISDVHSLGLERAQGLRLTEAFYWDMNDKTRAFAKRFAARNNGKMPTSVQAGFYSAALQYLNAVKAAGTDDSDKVMAKLKELKWDDPIFGPSYIRADGRKMHSMYLFEVKAPSESKGPWDYYKLIATIPGEEAFRPIEQGECPMIAKKN